MKDGKKYNVKKILRGNKFQYFCKQQIKTLIITAF